MDSTTVEFATSAINTRVLFENDGTPAMVEVYVQVNYYTTSFLLLTSLKTFAYSCHHRYVVAKS